MNWNDCKSLCQKVLDLYLDSNYFLLISIIVILILIIVILFICKKNKNLLINEVNAFSINIKFNIKNVDIAYMIYIQLKTRKIGIAFTDEDIISEVYKSWYTSFSEIRNLLLSIKPIPKNAKLIKIGESILNEGMRPHLTKWQGKYNRWYAQELQKSENKNLTPQEIQCNYPQYNELVKDIKSSQKEILNFIVELEDNFKSVKNKKRRKKYGKTRNRNK